MKKTILFPTDFTIESLNLVKSVLSRLNESCKYDIILLHGLHASDSITDLLFFSKSRVIGSLTSPEFEDACGIIKNKFSSHINSMRKDIFNGVTQASFDNYAEANKIEAAFVPAKYSPVLGKKSFDIIPFIKRSSVQINEVEWNVSATMPEKGKLAEVFFNGGLTSN